DGHANADRQSDTDTDTDTIAEADAGTDAEPGTDGRGDSRTGGVPVGAVGSAGPVAVAAPQRESGRSGVVYRLAATRSLRSGALTSAPLRRLRVAAKL